MVIKRLKSILKSVASRCGKGRKGNGNGAKGSSDNANGGNGSSNNTPMSHKLLGRGKGRRPNTTTTTVTASPIPQGLEKSLKDGTMHVHLKIRGRNRVHYRHEIAGTGFFAYKNGLIWSSAHIFSDIDEDRIEPDNLIRIHLENGYKFYAKLLYMDMRYDISLLKINPTCKISYRPTGTVNVTLDLVVCGNAPYI